MKLLLITTLICCVSAFPLLENSDEEMSEYDHAYFEELEQTRLTVSEQDIINRDQGPAGMRKAALSSVEAKWPNARVPVLLSTSLSRIEKDEIRDATREIQRKTCIRFTLKKPEDNDFISIVKPSGRFCNSYVGRIGGGQVINLGPGCFERHLILHELMHALGFIHEHNRPDRDDYIKVNFDNIIEDNYNDFTKRSQKEVILYNKEYAYDSIMHYESNAFAVDPDVATITPRDENVKKLGGNVLSAVDVEQLNRHYCGGKPTKPGVPTSTPTLPTTSAKPTLPTWIDWIIQPDGGIWAFGCTFTGTPMETLNIRGEDCGQRCVEKEGCDHFMWKAGNGGACSLMNGYKPNNAIAGTDRNRSCGIVMFRVDRKYNIN